MSDEIFFDGKRYISANEAGVSSDLSRDYIARLCRDGKISGRRVGTHWYVEQSSLRDFLIFQEYAKIKRSESLVKTRIQEYQRTTPARFFQNSAEAEIGPVNDYPESPETSAADHAFSFRLSSNETIRTGSGKHVSPHVSTTNQTPRVFPSRVDEGNGKEFSSSSKHTSRDFFKSTNRIENKVVTVPPVARVSRVISSRADEIKNKMALAVAGQSRDSLGQAKYLFSAPGGLAHAAFQALPMQGAMHVQLSALSPVIEFFHKLVALTLTLMLVFGTYAAVDPSYARFAADSVRENVNATLDTYHAATGGGLGELAYRTQTQVAAVAENPERALASVQSALTESIPSFAARLARNFNSRTDKLVYAIAFPLDLVGSHSTVARGEKGSVAVSVVPYTNDVQVVVTTQRSEGSITQNIVNQPTIERVVETSRLLSAGGISEELLDKKLAALEARLSAGMFYLSSANSTNITNVYASAASVGRIEHLDGVDLTNPTITGGTISSARSLSVVGNSSLATTTVNGDLTVTGTITGGSVSLGTTTISGDLTLAGSLNFSGSSSTINATGATFTNATTTNFYASRSVFDAATSTSLFANNAVFGTSTSYNVSVAPYFVATSTTATSTFAGSFSIGTSQFFVDHVTGQVGIGTISPFPSALLQLDSTAQAFLPPRMTTAQKNAIGSPTGGLVLYDSDLNKLNVYNGTAWKNVGSTEVGGEVTNGITNSVLFIGDGAILAQDNSNFSFSTSTNRLLLTQASTTRLSVFGTAYFGGTATTTIDSAGNLSVAGTLGVTGKTTLGNASSTNFTASGNASVAGWFGVGTTTPGSLLSVHGGGYISSNLFVGGYITSTSTTASSFPYASSTAFTATNLFSTNFLTLGSTTLQDFTAVNATTTNATSTNFFATIASSTNLYATNANLGTLVASYFTLGSLTGPLQAIGGNVSASSTLSTFYGGTGANTFATNGVLFGNGAGALQATAAAANSILVSNGSSVPAFSTTLPAFTLGGAITGNSQNITSLNNISSTNSTITYSSSTALTVSGTGYFDTASTTNLTISGTQTFQNLASGALAVNASGAVYKAATTTFSTGITYVGGAVTCDTASGSIFGCLSAADWTTFNNKAAFPFTPATFGATAANSTSTLIGFTNGIYALASSTIGNGAQAGGLTISGGATTTGNAYIAGNVGIGTAGPSALLHVLGITEQLRLGYDTSNYLKTTVDSGGGATFLTTGSAPDYTFRAGTGGNFNLQANNAAVGAYVVLGDGFFSPSITSDNAMTLGRTNARWSALYVGTGNSTFAGNLGIGTTTPWGKLSVAGAAAATSPLFTVSSSTASATTTVFHIDANGLVGIASSTPGSLFSIGNTGGINFSLATSTFSTTGGINLASGCFSINGACVGGSSAAGTTGNVQFYSGGLLSANSTFTWNNTSGFLGIGTSTPYAKLSIWGADTSNSTHSFLLADSASTTVLSISNGGIFNFGKKSTTTIPNNSPYAWTIATSSTGSPLFSIDTTSGSESVNFGRIGGDVTIGAVGSASNLVFEENSTIRGQGSGRTLTFGANSDSFAFGISSLAGCDVLYTTALGVISCGASSSSLFTNSGNVTYPTTTNNLFAVGTTTPFAQLQIASSSASATFKAQLTLTDTNGGTDAKHLAFAFVNGEFRVGTTSDAYATSTLFSITNASTTISKALFSSSAATSSFANGLNLTSGCWAVQGTCIGGASSQWTTSGSNIYYTTGSVGIGTTTPGSLLSVHGGGYISSNLFVGGYITSTSTIASTFPYASSTAITSSGSAYFATSGGSVGVGTTTPFRKFSVSDTVSTAQAVVAYDATRYAEFRVDTSGDLNIGPQGGDTFLNNDNFWVCTGGSIGTNGCPAGAPTGQGNLIVENKTGIGTSTPAYKLTIETQDTTTDFFQIASSSKQGVFVVKADGRVGIGSTTPTTLLSIGGLLTVGANPTGAPATMGTATSTFNGDIKIVGKLDVGTIDPVYTIDGVKYATYGHSTIGIHEETMQTIQLSEKGVDGKYVYIIDFNKLEKGSDLWLFYQVTDMGQDWKGLVVALTPSFDGTVFYRKDVKNGKLVISGDSAGEVSMRLTAYRYDFTKWKNLRPDQDGDTTGSHVISSKPQPAVEGVNIAQPLTQ